MLAVFVKKFAPAFGDVALSVPPLKLKKVLAARPLRVALTMPTVRVPLVRRFAAFSHIVPLMPPLSVLFTISYPLVPTALGMVETLAAPAPPPMVKTQGANELPWRMFDAVTEPPKTLNAE